MVYKCSAVGCKSGYTGIYTPGVSFHSYPLNDSDLCEKWKKANPRRNFVPTRNSKICSLHFLPTDFIEIYTDSNKSRMRQRNKLSRDRLTKKLKQNAVPSVFLYAAITRKKQLELDEHSPSAAHNYFEVIEAMNIAKKSTTRNGTFSRSSNALPVENLNGNRAFITGDTQSNVKVTNANGAAENGLSSATQDAGDDVIICDVELPHSDSKPSNSKVNGLPLQKGATAASLNSSLTAEPTKRSLDSSIENASKKVRLSISASQLQQNVAGPPKPKIYFMTFEQVESIVQESLKQESLRFQKEISERFSKEITDLKNEVQRWKTTATSLKNQICVLKNKLGNKKKNSPCNLPPVSANPLTSQHLKMLHNNNTSAVTPNVQVSNLLGLTSISPQLSSPAVVIQPHQPVQPSKLGSVIDLTDEDDASKKEASSDNNKTDSGTQRKESELGTLKPFSELYPAVPPPPSPLADQSAVPNAKGLPPRPVLSLTVRPEGVVLTWDCPSSPNCEEIVSFHLLSYQLKDYPDERGWKRVGNIKAMPLPMVCTLEKSKLERHAVFALRGEDQHCRIGLCSNVVILDKERVT